MQIWSNNGCNGRDKIFNDRSVKDGGKKLLGRKCNEKWLKLKLKWMSDKTKIKVGGIFGRTFDWLL